MAELISCSCRQSKELELKVTRKKKGKKNPKSEQCKREALFSPVKEFICLFICCLASRRNKDLPKQSRATGGIPSDKGLNNSCKDTEKNAFKSWSSSIMLLLRQLFHSAPILLFHSLRQNPHQDPYARSLSRG